MEEMARKTGIKYIPLTDISVKFPEYHSLIFALLVFKKGIMQTLHRLWKTIAAGREKNTSSYTTENIIVK